VSESRTRHHHRHAALMSCTYSDSSCCRGCGRERSWVQTHNRWAGFPSRRMARSESQAGAKTYIRLGSVPRRGPASIDQGEPARVAGSLTNSLARWPLPALLCSGRLERTLLYCCPHATPRVLFKHGFGPRSSASDSAWAATLTGTMNTFWGTLSGARSRGGLSLGRCRK
jgi:hypothetical protein